MDKNRRNFLKFLLIGGGALVLVKMFRSGLFGLFSGSRAENKLGGFRTVEDKKGLAVFDKGGEKILIFDKEK